MELERIKKQAREEERKKAIKVLNYLIDTKGTMGGDFIDQTQYNLYNFRDEFKKRLREERCPSGNNHKKK